MFEYILNFLGFIVCYECNGTSGEPAHRTVGEAYLCIPCRDKIQTARDDEKYVTKLIFHLAEYEFQYCIDHEKDCELCKEIVRLDKVGAEYENEIET